MRRFEALLVGSGLAGLIALGFLGLGLTPDLLSSPSNPVWKQKRVEFSIKPGGTHRIMTYMVGGAKMRFDSDSGAGRVRYRLRLEDGHRSFLIANAFTAAKERGELSPPHGSLYEWTWENPSPRPVHITFSAEGDFEMLDRAEPR